MDNIQILLILIILLSIIYFISSKHENFLGASGGHAVAHPVAHPVAHSNTSSNNTSSNNTSSSDNNYQSTPDDPPKDNSYGGLGVGGLVGVIIGGTFFVSSCSFIGYKYYTST